MWFNPDLARLFITSTLLHLGEDINLLVVSVVPKALANGDIIGKTIGEELQVPTMSNR